jgi:hypothetical protein
MRVSERMLFTTRFGLRSASFRLRFLSYDPTRRPDKSLETQSTQRENIFSFLLRGQKRKDIQRDGI